MAKLLDNTFMTTITAIITINPKPDPILSTFFKLYNHFSSLLPVRHS